MFKKYLIITLWLALCVPVSFAGLEDTSGHAAWTATENNTGHATFGVGNATNSYTDWLTIPNDAEWAAVQICDSTSSSTVNYVYNASTDSTRFAGAITNASFVIELAPLTVTAATPPITTSSIPVFDIVDAATKTAVEHGPAKVWTDYNFSSIPIINRKGLFRIPLHGEKNMRVKFTRSGATTASTYHWCYVHFDKR